MNKQEKYAKNNLLDIKVFSNNLRIRLQMTEDLKEWKETKRIIKDFKLKGFNVYWREKDYEKSFTSQIRGIKKG